MSRVITLEVSSCRDCPLRRHYDNTRHMMCTHPAAPKDWGCFIPVDAAGADRTLFPSRCPGKDQA